MTTNQLMTLLAIHRGTLDQEFKIGTFSNDIQYLERMNVIQLGKDGWELTAKGEEVVQACKRPHQLVARALNGWQ